MKRMIGELRDRRVERSGREDLPFTASIVKKALKTRQRENG
jgi:hypothetical protein